MPGRARPRGQSDAPAEEAKQDERPHEIELLLCGERPEVRELRRQSVGMPSGQRVVHHVAEAGRDAENRLTRIGDDDRDGQEHRKECERGRKQPKRAPAVERAEANESGATLLVEQQRRDQESREDEEEVDAEQPCCREREVRGVIEDDRRDRDRAESVE